MLDSVRIQRRQSEIRSELSVLAGKADASPDEIRSMETLDAEYRSNETRYRAALIAEDGERREAGAEMENRSDREFADLVDRFELRQVALHLDEGASLSGATSEVVTELRTQGGYRGVPVPFAALEQRAGETIGSGLVEPKQTRDLIGRIFPQSLAAKMGVASVNIPSGAVEWPILTAGAVAGWANGELADVGTANAAQTGEVMLKPDHNLGAQMVLSRKSLKQTAGIENAIRADMSAAIAVALDDAVVNGTGATGQPLGLIPGAATYGINVEAVAALDSWAAFRAEVIAFLEANAITDPSQVRLAFPPAVWGALDDALVTGTAVSELDRMAKHGIAPVLANQLPADHAILTATVNGIAPAFLGIYGAVDLIRDPYTRAASGQLVLTGIVTADFTATRGVQTRILSVA
ncbi:phage major capsid protein [Altericroceibacterium spongiae]|uniref:Phage major capsid protein n=1 Tax=Altericroceibacterium spongiae TaxID=2320269 RepID=A0A420EPY6_9SPHN|nr:phage major capsid protein [Altericroceibacterium spongiae]RKF22724.1 phage major capsid protein [Altericroceibacterium spongiae]